MLFLTPTNHHRRNALLTNSPSDLPSFSNLFSPAEGDRVRMPVRSFALGRRIRRRLFDFRQVQPACGRRLPGGVEQDENPLLLHNAFASE